MGRKKRVSKSMPELSRLEQDVMNVIWDLGDCSSAEVIEVFTRKRKLAKTTIRTVMSNLRKKGYIEPIPTIERGFRFRSCVSRDVVAKRSLKNVVSGLFEGSPRQAIAYLLRDEEIDETDLEEIRRMLDERKGGGGK